MALSPEEAVARVRAVFGDTIDAKPLHAPVSEDSDEEIVDLITRVCYFYPQYTLDTASLLTNAEVTALLVQADKQEAIRFYNLTLISAAPHSKKGAMVNKLLKQYRKIAE